MCEIPHMTSSRRFLMALLGGASVFSTACASGGARTAVPSGAAAPALRVYDSKANRFIPFTQLADAAAKADFVFFGEQHDDPATHASELAVLAALGERRPSVVVTLEMFERDVQPLVDQYLAGTISEANFLVAPVGSLHHRLPGAGRIGAGAWMAGRRGQCAAPVGKRSRSPRPRAARHLERGRSSLHREREYLPEGRLLHEVRADDDGTQRRRRTADSR
jgi:hypothetical protein